jgi:hypothetical protein
MQKQRAVWLLFVFNNSGDRSVHTAGNRIARNSGNTSKNSKMFDFLPVLLEDGKQRVSIVHTEAIEVEKYEHFYCRLWGSANIRPTQKVGQLDLELFRLASELSSSLFYNSPNFLILQ